MPEDEIQGITVTQTFVNHDRKNKRIDILGSTAGYRIVVNHIAYSISLLDVLNYIDKNALYQIADTPNGVDFKAVHVPNVNKEEWN